MSNILLNHQVKSADFQHQGKLTELFEQYLKFYGQEFMPGQAFRFIQQRLHRQDSQIFVCENNKGELAGFVQIYPLLSSVCMQQAFILNDLYVSEHYRNLGVATALMHAARDYAAGQNAAWMELETAVDNIKAQALYRKMGWQDVNVLRFAVQF